MVILDAYALIKSLCLIVKVHAAPVIAVPSCHGLGGVVLAVIYVEILRDTSQL